MADLTAKTYDSSGAETGTLALDPEIFGLEPNVPLMHQVVTAQLAGARAGTASTKTRAEVRGGGRKPWRQKGLGRARHGSIRSPQWRGGGVVFGPKPRSYAQRTPKKMKRLALRSALSTRAAADAIAVVDQIEWSTPKTKQALSMLDAMNASGKILLVLDRSDEVAARSVRNLTHVQATTVGQLSTYNVLWADTLVFTADTISRVAGAKGAYEVTDTDFVREEEVSDEVAS